MAGHRIARWMPRLWGVGLTVAIGVLAPGLPLAIAADENFPTSLLILAAVTAIPWLWLILRAARMALIATDDGLTVRNYLITRRIAWSEIEELRTGLGATAWQTGRGRLELVIKLKTARNVLTSATTTPAEKVAKLIADLGPIAKLAEEHGVPYVWEGLDELTQIRIRQALIALGDASGRLARFL